MSQSIKKNFFYSSILTVSNYLFPLITYPYVSRVLGVEKIGMCNFIDSIISYFILLSMLGIGTIGIRAVAKYKNDKEQLSREFSSIFIINTALTSIAVVCLIAVILFVPKLQEYKSLLYIGLFKLIFNYLLIDWFYKGLEKFGYITKRTLAVKTLYVFSVFIFVKNADDYIVYYLLSVLMIVANAIINITHSHKYITFKYKCLHFKDNLISTANLGLYSVLTSLYTTFNVAFLGFVSNNVQVGYYTTAIKLYGMILALFSAFTGVMLPRMSSLISERKFEEFKKMVAKSVLVLFAFVFPLLILVEIYAPEIILALSGKGYEGAILPMRIIMPLMFVVGYEQILVIQILMPLNKDRAILINSLIGAVVGILMNILIVPYIQSVGTAIVWLVSEISVLLSAQLFVSKYIQMHFPKKDLFIRIIIYAPLFILTYSIKSYLPNLIIGIIFSALFVATFVLLAEVRVLKNEILKNFLVQIYKKKQNE